MSPLFAVSTRTLDDDDARADEAERIAQLVRQPGEELGLVAVRFAQRFLRRPLVGDVGVGSEPARDASGRVPNRERAR